jgi:hypothetical protein
VTCRPVRLADGVKAIVCTRGTRRRCVCGRPATKLCDFPTGRGTCDKPLCGRCARPVGPDRDFCPNHPREEKTQCLI